MCQPQPQPWLLSQKANKVEFVQCVSPQDNFISTTEQIISLVHAKTCVQALNQPAVGKALSSASSTATAESGPSASPGQRSILNSRLNLGRTKQKLNALFSSADVHYFLTQWSNTYHGLIYVIFQAQLKVNRWILLWYHGSFLQNIIMEAEFWIMYHEICHIYAKIKENSSL